MALKLITPPAVEPVSLADAKLHLRVDGSTDDTLITALITAARELAEGHSWRALATTVFELLLDDWPCGDVIELPRPPLQSVASVTYRLADGTVETLSAASYVVDTDSEPGRVALADGVNWPTSTLYPVGAVRIRFTAGYTTVPVRYKQAVLLLIGHWYENRETVVASGAIPKELPLGAAALLSVDRNYRGGA